MVADGRSWVVGCESDWDREWAQNNVTEEGTGWSNLQVKRFDSIELALIIGSNS